METTFISIHDLSDRATILYSSDSVIDILGYTPDDIVNHSAWEFFPEDELPLARKFHQKRVASDKAAVLAYVRVRDKNGQWIGCECCFTIVYDVMVVCTSIYQRGTKSEKRALDAPMVRRIFSSSPKDPRYHMLSHLSAKFSQPVQKQVHEPRAALFLNRFTRTLTIMYATSGLNEVIGIPAETMRGRSFYYCIAENCLNDAVRCLENAKGNDSIAYMRFWFRDPRTDDQPAESEASSDDEMTTDTSEDGGVHLQSVEGATNVPAPRPASSMDVDSDESKADSRHSSGDSTRAADTHEAIFGHPPGAESSTSSLAPSPQRARNSPGAVVPEPIELEAVISCTSDGLVVCLRRARPMIPHPAERPALPVHQNGLFAAPWAHEPILPPRAGTGYGSAFAPALGPQGARRDSPTAAVGGPDQMDFMNSIRDQAIFAWALTGINGCLADYGHGKPTGEALPSDGLPIWSESQIKGDVNPANLPDGLGAAARKQQDGSRGPHIFGDPGLDRNSNNGSRGMGSNSNSSSGTPYPPGPGQQ